MSDRVALDNPDWIRTHFGEMDFAPAGGYVLRVGQRLPALVWDHPEAVASVLDDIAIPTQWFDADLQPVESAEKPGLYYVYGAGPSPDGRDLRRSKTCCCVDADTDLLALAKEFGPQTPYDLPEQIAFEHSPAETAQRWQDDEQALFHLCMHLYPITDKRPGAWEMANANVHLRLKRQLSGLNDQGQRPHYRQLSISSAPILHAADFSGDGPGPDVSSAIEQAFTAWCESEQIPSSLVVAHRGRIICNQSYGSLRGASVDEHTPFLLHSAMKPLMGIHLAMYIDNGLINLKDPVGKYLSDFNTEWDEGLDFHACQTHCTGIDVDWEVAFQRHLYFHTWFETMVAHCPRLWKPWEQFRYGMVGMSLTVRSLEMIGARNYWEAMEEELFKPLGITDMWPGGTGFSTENLARLGVLMCNHGRYGDKEFFTEETYQQIIPALLPLTNAAEPLSRGIGFGPIRQLGPGGYGHAGGCGTQLLINPERQLVVALMRNDRGEDYGDWLQKICEPLADE